MNMSNTPKIIGFLSPPRYLDPAPGEFPHVVTEPVRTQQAPLLMPDFVYDLESIADTGGAMALNAATLKAMGCDLVAQVGCPFCWAKAASEEEARERCREISRAASLPVIMTGLAMVDALRALGVKRVAANCTYYDGPWRDAFAAFLGLCGFEVVHASNLADQDLAAKVGSVDDYGWSMTKELTRRSLRIVGHACPEAEAIAVTGAGARTLSLLAEAEKGLGRPVVAADTALYWAAARELGLTLLPFMGSLARAQ